MEDATSVGVRLGAGLLAAFAAGVAFGIDDGVGCDVRVGTDVSVGDIVGLDVVLETILAREDEPGVGVIS